MEVTYEQIITFSQMGENYQTQHSGKFSPFLYAISKQLKKVKKYVEDYAEAEREINIDHAEKKDGFCMTDDKDRFKFLADKLMVVNKAKRELLAKKIKLDFEGHIPENLDIPNDIDFRWWNVLSPFVLPEEIPDEMLQKLYERGQKKDKPKLPVSANGVN